MPHILKTVLDELVIDQNAGRTTRVRTVDNHFSFRIERPEKNFFESEGTRNPLFPKHPLVQSIDQREIVSSFELLL